MGRIGRPFGVQGWLHVESWCDPPEQLLTYTPWQLARSGAAPVEAKVIEGRRQRDGLVVRLEGVSTREAAAALTGRQIEIERSRLPQAAPGTWYQVDLVGCRVVNEEGIELGVIDHFVDAPAGAVMVVRGEAEHWVPAVAPHLKTVDLASRQVLVDWPADF